MDRWIDGWMDGWMVGWIDGWMDGRTDSRMDSWRNKEIGIGVNGDGETGPPDGVMRENNSMD